MSRSVPIPTLEELYQFLYDNPTIVVEIGGHTNSLPADEYCDRLSEARAKATADYIIAKGIDEKRILYKGYGKRQPIATNMTPEGRRRNQRVEVRIVKLSE
jgi:outer membrane protein OmpA-like peptidoglycan-associated protein